MPAPFSIGSLPPAPKPFHHQSRSDGEIAEITKGKSAESPAHQARAAITAATGQGEAPANLHGKVTSAIARGLDPASLLVLQSVGSSDPEVGEEISGSTSQNDGASGLVTEEQESSDEEATQDAGTAASAVVASEDIQENGDTSPTPVTPPTGEAQILDILSESLDKDKT